ncbi:MAG: helix-turn-helix domain-containing protein [Dehalococcoidia bacterium]
MLTTRQVANLIQVSICSVRRWSNSGMLKCYRVGLRGDRRYRYDEVIRFLEGRSHRPLDTAERNVTVRAGIGRSSA